MLKNLPLLITLEHPPPPQRRRLDTDGSFKPIGVSEVPGELELRANRVNLNTVEIEDLQADDFARKFNSPLTKLNDHVIVQVHPFDPPVIGVSVGRIMSTAGESYFTSTSATPTEGVIPPPVGAPRTSIPITPLTSDSRVVQPPAPTSLAGASGGMVTGIPSVPRVPTSFAHTAQSGPIGSSTFIQGFPWNGGHIPRPLHT